MPPFARASDRSPRRCHALAERVVLVATAAGKRIKRDPCVRIERIKRALCIRIEHMPRAPYIRIRHKQRATAAVATVIVCWAQ